MTDDERGKLADQLLALVFSLRPPEPAKGDAWALSTMSGALARAIVATVGPTADANEILDLAAQEVRRMVTETQSKFIQAQLAVGPGGPRH